MSEPRPSRTARLKSHTSTIRSVYLIIGLFVALILCQLSIIQLQIDALTAIRAYVGGEGLWAKAQKEAMLDIDHYAASHDEADCLAYRREIQVPLGDRKARIELQKENPNIAVVLASFVEGRNHPDDLWPAVRFFRHFQHRGYMSQVIAHWTAGDNLIAEFDAVAEALHEEIASGHPDTPSAVTQQCCPSRWREEPSISQANPKFQGGPGQHPEILHWKPSMSTVESFRWSPSSKRMKRSVAVSPGYTGPVAVSQLVPAPMR